MCDSWRESGSPYQRVRNTYEQAVKKRASKVDEYVCAQGKAQAWLCDVEKNGYSGANWVQL